MRTSWLKFILPVMLSSANSSSLVYTSRYYVLVYFLLNNLIVWTHNHMFSKRKEYCIKGSNKAISPSSVKSNRIDDETYNSLVQLQCRYCPWSPTTIVFVYYYYYYFVKRTCFFKKNKFNFINFQLNRMCYIGAICKFCKRESVLLVAIPSNVWEGIKKRVMFYL